MIEAMACGTPVIDFRQGSVPEIVKHGVTGFIVNTVAEAVRAVDKLNSIDRAQVRATFEHRFSAECMAKNYEAAYAELCGMRDHVVTMPKGTNRSMSPTLRNSEAFA